MSRLHRNAKSAANAILYQNVVIDEAYNIEEDQFIGIYFVLISIYF